MNILKTCILFITLFIITSFVVITYMYYTKQVLFSIIQHSYSKKSFITFPSGELLSGSLATGKFKALEDNLGIIEIRFLTYGRVTADSIVFRLKEKSSKEWYYVNTYKAKEFGGYPLFPFGFPIINNSKDKIYYFELESLYGRKERAVSISTFEPVIITKHKFNLPYLLENKKN